MTFPISKPGRNLARRAAQLMTLAGVALMLAGCYSAKEEATASIPNDYRKRHPIAIKESNQTVELLIGKSRGSLLPAQRAEVLGFAHSWRREGTGGIIIDVPSATPNGHAAHEAVREVRSIFAAAGVPDKAVVVRPYQTDPYQLATVRLNFPKMTAEAGPCGLWPQDLGPTMDPTYNQNKPYFNLGCANQRNLAAMVADPADLIQPRAETPVYAARRSTVLEKYRKGDEFSGKYPGSYDKAKLSDVGK